MRIKYLLYLILIQADEFNIHLDKIVLHFVLTIKWFKIRILLNNFKKYLQKYEVSR